MDPFTDPEWCEREYNPAVTVPEPQRFGQTWTQKAEAARARLNGSLDIVYGTHPREKYDLFRAAKAKGCIIYIHGGYWRAGDKSMYSWMAEALNAAGFTVAVFGYPLCPEVTIADIVVSCRKAVAHLVQQSLTADEKARLVITGHSAGGYLTAAMLATDWSQHGMAMPFAAGVPISGVFWLPPLVHTSMNQLIRMDDAQARAWSLAHGAKAPGARVLPVVGGDESAEFHRQSALLQTHWRQHCDSPLAVAGTNHFTVIEGLADPSSSLFRLAVEAGR